jgi:hypothetical protein
MPDFTSPVKNDQELRLKNVPTPVAILFKKAINYKLMAFTLND